jgi:hypothetical protein
MTHPHLHPMILILLSRTIGVHTSEQSAFLPIGSDACVSGGVELKRSVVMQRSAVMQPAVEVCGDATCKMELYSSDVSHLSRYVLNTISNSYICWSVQTWDT